MTNPLTNPTYIKYAGYLFLIVGAIGIIKVISKEGMSGDVTGPFTILGIGIIIVAVSK